MGASGRKPAHPSPQAYQLQCLELPLVDQGGGDKVKVCRARALCKDSEEYSAVLELGYFLLALITIPACSPGIRCPSRQQRRMHRIPIIRPLPTLTESSSSSTAW